MAERGPRTEGGRREREGHAYGEPGPGVPAVHGGLPDAARSAGADPALVRIRDLSGRALGLGFLADHEGTLLTSHETVDGRPRLLLHAPGERTRPVTADAVTPLPSLGLALIRTEGLGADPLPLTVRERIDAGSYVRIAAGCWREARVLGATPATYTAGDGCHLLKDALELAIGTAGRDALRPGGGAAGGRCATPAPARSSASSAPPSAPTGARRPSRRRCGPPTAPSPHCSPATRPPCPPTAPTSTSPASSS